MRSWNNPSCVKSRVAAHGTRENTNYTNEDEFHEYEAVSNNKKQFCAIRPYSWNSCSPSPRSHGATETVTVRKRQQEART